MLAGICAPRAMRVSSPCRVAPAALPMLACMPCTPPGCAQGCACGSQLAWPAQDLQLHPSQSGGCCSTLGPAGAGQAVPSYLVIVSGSPSKQRGQPSMPSPPCHGRNNMAGAQTPPVRSEHTPSFQRTLPMDLMLMAHFQTQEDAGRMQAAGPAAEPATTSASLAGTGPGRPDALSCRWPAWRMWPGPWWWMSWT